MAVAATSSLVLENDGSLYLYYGSVKQSAYVFGPTALSTSFSPLVVLWNNTSPTITLSSVGLGGANMQAVGVRFEPATFCSMGSTATSGAVNGGSWVSVSSGVYTTTQTSTLTIGLYAVCVLGKFANQAVGDYELYFQVGAPQYLKVLGR